MNPNAEDLEHALYQYMWCGLACTTSRGRVPDPPSNTDKTRKIPCFQLVFHSNCYCNTVSSLRVYCTSRAVTLNSFLQCKNGKVPQRTFQLHCGGTLSKEPHTNAAENILVNCKHCSKNFQLHSGGTLSEKPNISGKLPLRTF